MIDLKPYQNHINNLCKLLRVQELELFGSATRDDFSPDSDIDVLVVGDADLRDLRRRLRPVGRMAGRTIDLTVLTVDEFQGLVADRSSFARRVLEEPTTSLIGDLASIA